MHTHRFPNFSMAWQIPRQQNRRRKVKKSKRERKKKKKEKKKRKKEVKNVKELKWQLTKEDRGIRNRGLDPHDSKERKNRRREDVQRKK